MVSPFCLRWRCCIADVSNRLKVKAHTAILYVFDKAFADKEHTVIVWLDANAPRLGAFVNEETQIRGELVWPVLDCDHASGKHD